MTTQDCLITMLQSHKLRDLGYYLPRSSFYKYHTMKQITLEERGNISFFIQYGISLLLIISGIVIAFMSFFFNSYDISSGVLTYIGEAFVTAGGFCGVAVYIKNAFVEAEVKVKDTINKEISRRLPVNPDTSLSDEIPEQ